MKFTFVGCSFTVGEGLENEKDDPQNYCNLTSRHFDATVENLAVKGNSNYNIFITALNKLVNDPGDKLFVQWSGLHRLWVYPGPDTSLFVSIKPESDYSYRDLYIPKANLQKFVDTYQLLSHDYNSILTVINYSNILSKISNNNIVFINGLVPWTQDLATVDSLSNPWEKFSLYTKEILDFDNRDDVELRKLFTLLYNNIESLDKELWVNMFNPFNKIAIDVGNDKKHPGPYSHKHYSELIIKYLETKV